MNLFDITEITLKAVEVKERFPERSSEHVVVTCEATIHTESADLLKSCLNKTIILRGRADENWLPV